MKTKSEKTYLVTLLEQNGDYEYERIGLIKTDKSAKKESERIARKWYSETSEPSGDDFLFHQGCVSVAVGEIKQITSKDSKVLLRHLPSWE